MNSPGWDMSAAMHEAARIAAVVGLLVFAAACTAERDESAPAESVRLVSAAPGTLPRTYTLADETRPVLAVPPEVRVQVSVPSGLRDEFTFPVPGEVAPGEMVATGILQRRRMEAIPPTVVRVVAGSSGTRNATIALPELARGPGPPSSLALVLTAPTSDGAVETVVRDVGVPRDATLHFAYALSDASGIADAAPVLLEVVAGEATGERKLWFTEVRAASADARHWRETSIPLTVIGDTRVNLIFRARSAGQGRPLVVPLWADPTITVPARRPPERRNVILISLDTLRADRVGVYGAYRPTTPAIDALASESVVFTEAFAPWPETSGSHMSLFTSRYPSEHGVVSFITAPSEQLELLAERLRREGYLTRAFTEDGGVWANAGFARGFSAYSERRSADFVYRGEAAATFADATRWVEANAGRTFFLFVHTYQVHAPYAPPRAYRAIFADIPGREQGTQRINALAYDRETRFTDDQVGPFIAALRRLGLAERSIVILTSDHGEEFGEHGGTGHGRTLHREVLQVPLIVWAPGLLAPARVGAPTSLLDVAPTLLELLGLAPDAGYRGVSMAGAARGDAVKLDRAIASEVDRVDAVRHDQIHQVAVRQEGRTAITDVETGVTRCYGADDRDEQRPVAPDAASGDALVKECAALALRIAEHRRDAVPVGTAPAHVTDPRLLEKMRALGYIE